MRNALLLAWVALLLLAGTGCLPEGDDYELTCAPAVIVPGEEVAEYLPGGCFAARGPEAFQPEQRILGFFIEDEECWQELTYTDPVYGFTRLAVCGDLHAPGVLGCSDPTTDGSVHDTGVLVGTRYSYEYRTAFTLPMVDIIVFRTPTMIWKPGPGCDPRHPPVPGVHLDAYWSYTKDFSAGFGCFWPHDDPANMSAGFCHSSSKVHVPMVHTNPTPEGVDCNVDPCFTVIGALTSAHGR